MIFCDIAIRTKIGIHTLEYQYLACSLSCSTPNPWCRQRPYTKHPKAIPLATYCGRQSVSRARPSTSSCSPTLDALNRTQSKLNNAPLGPLKCEEGDGSENVAYTVNSRFHRISVTVDSRKRIKTVVWTRIHRCVFDDNENAYLWKRIYGQGLRQNNNSARASRFLYISLPSLHGYDVKTTRFSFHFFKTLILFLGIQFQKSSLAVDKVSELE